MLKKLYVHNFRCLQNFVLDLQGIHTALLIGRNGTGKSAVLAVFSLLQQIGRGVTEVGDLVDDADFAFLEYEKPLVLEVTLVLAKQEYVYHLEFEYPAGFRAPRIKKEVLRVDGEVIFAREGGHTTLYGKAEFTLDWHRVGLPLVSVRSKKEPVALLQQWLADIVVLRPTPKSMLSSIKGESQHVSETAANLVAWVRYHLGLNPSLYAKIDEYLRFWLQDFESFRLDETGKDERELLLQFRDKFSIELSLSNLSDGEKVYVLAAVLLAVMSTSKPTLCLWDEPDHFISLPELSGFIVACRKLFEKTGVDSQLVFTSHNPRVMYEFSGHNSFVLTRSSHLHPARISTLDECEFASPDTVQAYENGELG